MMNENKKHNKTYDTRKSNAKGDLYSYKHMKKTRKISSNNLTLHLKKLEEQTNPKDSREKERNKDQSRDGRNREQRKSMKLN